MTRRSYHMYVFRLDESRLGITREKFLQALQAEGVPASEGWHQPLYRNGVFINAHRLPPHGIRAPLGGKGVDYTGVSCPVCEQVCRDAVWIPQNVLLAAEPQIRRLAEAVCKVAAGAASLNGEVG
jgi:dTDP-4-amino-4,6-dideoxygalactose transaminase